ncbi:hypothetical protein M0657_012036 [Pyricularia oryzae]|nr:hypothetical protein M0657_012036 [Pyricularia oryzae]
MRYSLLFFAAHCAFAVAGLVQPVNHDGKTTSGAILARDNQIDITEIAGRGSSEIAKRALIDETEGPRRRGIISTALKQCSHIAQWAMHATKTDHNRMWRFFKDDSPTTRDRAWKVFDRIGRACSDSNSDVYISGREPREAETRCKDGPLAYSSVWENQVYVCPKWFNLELNKLDGTSDLFQTIVLMREISRLYSYGGATYYAGYDSLQAVEEYVMTAYFVLIQSDLFCKVFGTYIQWPDTLNSANTYAFFAQDLLLERLHRQ